MTLNKQMDRCGSADWSEGRKLRHWRMLSLPGGGWDTEAVGLGESISFVTRELIHVRGNWAGDKRTEQCSLGLDRDRRRVSKVKSGGLGTGCCQEG